MNLARRWHNLTHPALGRILMLHRISEQPASDPAMRRLTITPDFLQSSIFSMKQQGYHFVSIDQVTSRPKKRFACLTFDDGYRDNLLLALPILEKHDIPFCIYLTRDFYCGLSRPSWDLEAPMLNTHEVKLLAQHPLCTLGAHTLTHPRLSTLTPTLQHSEILDSKTDLEQLTSLPIHHFAYPHGDYNNDTLNIIKDCGFHTAVTTSGRSVRSDSNLLALDRIPLFNPNVAI